jgi:membrane fusion protein (multidrug efflux system)
MKLKLFIGIAIVVVVAGGLATVKALQIKTLIAAGAAYVPPPETVATVVVREEKWPDTLTAVGSVSAAQGVIVSPEIAGPVKEIAFESGATVKQGDLLVKLDTSSEEAQLRAAEAQVELAQLNADRTRVLRTDKTVSQSELDTAEATLKQFRANTDAIRAVIEKKTIRAPFAGRLGIRLVNLGELLDAGKGIVSLQALTPVFVDFSLPQQDLAQLQTGLPVRVVSDSYPSNAFSGELTAINPDLDTATRSVRVRAKFENADQLLRPGMFVRVEIILPDGKSVLAIPSTAILSAPFGDSVFVITTEVKDGKTNLVAQQKFIRAGRTRGDFVDVETNLNAGDRVASSGVFKLRSGASVQENNEDTPKSSQTPKPGDS